jgi:hypothetical protein
MRLDALRLVLSRLSTAVDALAVSSGHRDHATPHGVILTDVSPIAR